jgi:diguanylate cyclase (GGDEF)-like protein/PAS domain S-box-containing protein
VPAGGTGEAASAWALLDAVGQAVIATAPDGTVTYWNPAAETLYGWSRDEATGHPLAELVGTAGSQQLAGIRAQLAAGGSWSGELWVRRRSGEPLPVSVTSTPVRGADGAVDAIISVSADITDRKAADMAVRRLAAIVESSTDAILSKTPGGRITSWNDAAERLYGYSAEEAIGQHVSMVVPLDRIAELDEILAKVARGSTVDRLETVRIRKDGSEIQVLLSVWPLYDEDGEVVGASTVTHDITDRLLAEQGREAAEVRFQTAFRRSASGMMICDLSMRPTSVNPAVCRMLGRRPEELLGRWWTEFGHAAETPLEVAVQVAVAEGRDSYSDERRYIQPSGTELWVQVNVDLARGATGEPLFFMAQLHDITGRKHIEAQLGHSALHDDLTGLPNRALLDDRLIHALAGAERGGSQTGVAFLDLDGFKNVNDALGHPTGDQLLVEVGHRLLASVRPADTVARFGGDEFVLVCEAVSIDAMVGLAGRVTESLGRPFHVGGRTVSLHASLGITVSRRGSTAAALLSEADAAMYHAKELGRGRAAVFDDSLRTRAAALLEGERALRDAVDRHELVAYYQPIVDLRTNIAVGVEALVRWHTPDGRVVLRDDFIPLAESSGLIIRLGEAVLAQATADVARWNAGQPASPPLWVSVNLSAHQLSGPYLGGVVTGILRRTGLPSSLLHLEITETVVMDDITHSLEVLHDLKRLGVHLAIDDFGTGYSSLSYLQQMPFDVLKIDRSFVRALGSAADDASIVNAIVGLAGSLSMGCVAEGVETETQQEALAEMGCQLGQGYLWSRPLPPDQAEVWARSRAR